MFTLMADFARDSGDAMQENPRLLASKLTQERRSWLAAERLLELKQAELFAANKKLGQHAQQLSAEISETRAEVETIRGENQRVKSHLSAANRKVALTERRLWQSIESITDGFALFDGDMNLIMANRAYLSVFDGLEEIRPGVNYVTILQAMTDEGIVNPGSFGPSGWRRMMTERIQEPRPEPVVIQLWDRAYIRFMDQRGPDGDLVSLGINITATVKYEQQLKEARTVAESANRAKSAFLANMSHEIRTPMNGVVGMADVLADTGLSDEQRLYVDTIRNSGEALLVIINDVLDYSKIEAKKLELYPEEFDLERAIQEVLLLLQPSAKAKGLSLVLDYDLFIPTQLIGDPGRIRQVLTNLIGNAVKFTTEGHVLVRVTGVPSETTHRVKLHISIEDTGIGIPEDKIGHIFGEFNQVENERNRQFDGTGLGLAISKQLVEIMDGEIWVTSEEGVGSNFGFKVDLGMAGETEDRLEKPLQGLGQIVLLSEVEVKRVLLADQLEKLGAAVIACDTGEAAIQQLSPKTGLLLVDHDSAVGADLAFGEAVRAQDAEVPILLMSTNPGSLKGLPIRELAQGTLQFPPPRKDMIGQITALSRHQGFEPSAPEPLLPRVMRILAAEDNKTNQLVFRKMIKDLEVEVTFANNGEEAVALYQEISPDLIFMDISMPRMDGKEATRHIRALEEELQVHVPIVALTAHAMTGDNSEILEAGLDHYLPKPLRKPDIITRIEAVHHSKLAPLRRPQSAD
ncbi:MAG: ATP-binding protein [Pseudomonadota bacterium]